MTAAAIIGMGAICSAAAGVERGFEAIRQGTDGLSRFDAFETGLKSAPLCSPVKQVPGLSQAPNRTAAMALWAAQEVLAPIHNRHNLKLHIIVATTVAGMSRSEVFYRKFRQDPTTAARPIPAHLPEARSNLIAQPPASIERHDSLATAGTRVKSARTEPGKEEPRTTPSGVPSSDWLRALRRVPATG